MSKPKVLFLCFGNSARSQIAEGFVRHLAGDRLLAYSVGIEPRGLDPRAVEVMAEIGIDISSQQSKPASIFLAEHFGYIITVCSEAEKQCPTFPDISKRLRWPIPDPAQATGSPEDQLAVFRQVRDQLKQKITDWLREEQL